MHLTPTEVQKALLLMKTLIDSGLGDSVSQLTLKREDVSLVLKCQEWFVMAVINGNPVALALTNDGFTKLLEHFPQYSQVAYDAEPNVEVINHLNEILETEDPTLLRDRLVSFLGEETIPASILNALPPVVENVPVKEIPTKTELQDALLDKLAHAIEVKNHKDIASITASLQELNG